MIKRTNSYLFRDFVLISFLYTASLITKGGLNATRWTKHRVLGSIHRRNIHLVAYPILQQTLGLEVETTINFSVKISQLNVGLGDDIRIDTYNPKLDRSDFRSVDIVNLLI
jgi:hypothetical protein